MTRSQTAVKMCSPVCLSPYSAVCAAIYQSKILGVLTAADLLLPFMVSGLSNETPFACALAKVQRGIKLSSNSMRQKNCATVTLQF